MFFLRKAAPPQASRPGTLSEVPEALPTKLQAIVFTESAVEEYSEVDLSTLESLRASEGILWLDIQGLQDLELIRSVGRQFSLHPLALADIFSIPQRAKCEEFETHASAVTSMVQLDSSGALEREQLSIFWGSGFVLTVQERYGDVFNPIRSRLRAGKGPIRKSPSGYLAYAFLDAIVDAYYPVVEGLGQRVHVLEERIIEEQNPETITKIHDIRKTLVLVRTLIWPQRELLRTLVSDEFPWGKEDLSLYVRDCQDHVTQLLEVVDALSELCNGLLDIHLSLVSTKANDIMMMLTMIATIFIPLSFLAGIYGMNFQHMPELAHPLAYPVFWLVVLLVAGSISWYFWKKGWFGSRSAPSRPHPSAEESSAS